MAFPSPSASCPALEERDEASQHGVERAQAAAEPDQVGMRNFGPGTRNIGPERRTIPTHVLRALRDQASARKVRCTT